MKIVKLICDDRVFRTDLDKLKEVLEIDELIKNNLCFLIDGCYVFDMDPSVIQKAVNEARCIGHDNKEELEGKNLRQIYVPTTEPYSFFTGGGNENSQVDDIFKKLNITRTGDITKDLDNSEIEKAIKEYNYKIDNGYSTEKPFDPKLSEELRNMQLGGAKRRTTHSAYNTDQFTASEQIDSQDLIATSSEFFTEYKSVN